jgi:hypothetical protein
LYGAKNPLRRSNKAKTFFIRGLICFMRLQMDGGRKKPDGFPPVGAHGACCLATQTQHRQMKATCKFRMTQRVHRRRLHGASGIVRSNRTKRRNLYPTFTERRTAFASRTERKAFIVRSLMWLYAPRKGDVRKGQCGFR